MLAESGARGYDIDDTVVAENHQMMLRFPEELIAQHPVASTGSDCVDCCIDRCRAGTLVELCGAAGVGKTQALVALSLDAPSTLYISCTTSAMPKPHWASELQLQQVQEYHCGLSVASLHRILCEISAVRHAPSLVAIDGLSSCVAPPPAWASVQQSNAISRLMKSIAHSTGAVIVYTNHTTAERTNDAARPGLGSRWLAVPHARALMCCNGAVYCLSGAHAGFTGQFAITDVATLT